MLDASEDLRACISDQLGETFESDTGSFEGVFRSDFQSVAPGTLEVETYPPSIFAVTADIPDGLVKESVVRRSNGETWRVRRFEHDRLAGATVVVLKS